LLEEFEEVVSVEAPEAVGIELVSIYKSTLDIYSSAAGL
jgi:hypothetical protein